MGGLLLGPGPQEQLLQGRLAAASMGADGSGTEAPSFEVQATQELEEWDASVRARHASQLDASLAEDDETGVGAAAAAAAAVKGRPKRGRPSRVVDSSDDDDEEDEAGRASGASAIAKEESADGAEPSSVQPMSDSSVSMTEAAEQKEQEQQQQQQQQHDQSWWLHEHIRYHYHDRSQFQRAHCGAPTVLEVRLALLHARVVGVVRAKGWRRTRITV